ncbi:MAG: hypothetical protein OQL11_12715 [Gammaproteobacteria bacterium]|nr:hypothetical protein [Gammaproteobacteria bacterium]
MQSTKTYTNRTNARRAGIAAGIPKEQVEITVHKSGGEVRFGWKAAVQAPQAAKATASTHTATPTGKRPQPPRSAAPGKVQREERNGVKRPAPGGLCAAVWKWLDAHPTATVKEAKAAAPKHGWNENNVACEYYGWRKFNGISGRQQAAK